jgi:hypothetical protein
MAKIPGLEVEKVLTTSKAARTAVEVVARVLAGQVHQATAAQEAYELFGAHKHLAVPHLLEHFQALTQEIYNENVYQSIR